MSLDVGLYAVRRVSIFDANITHNLGRMAREAGIYEAMWRPEEIEVTTAGQLVPLLTEGLEKLRAEPAHFRIFDAPNGWGRYEHLVKFVEDYLAACIGSPDAEVETCR